LRRSKQQTRLAASFVTLVLGGSLASPPVTQAQAFQARLREPEELPDAPQPAFSVQQHVADSAVDDDLSLRRTPRRLLNDEWHIISSPARIDKHDLRWLLPLAGATAAAIATDSRTMRDVVSTNPGFNSANNTASGVLRDVLIGAPIVLFSAGELTKTSGSRDTGLLAGEAMINAYVTSEAIKYVTFRERPQISSARGHFFASDAASDPSFVSGHSIVAWSSAAVLAGEYRRPWQQSGIYGLASAVSVTRVLAQQHFPSDVLLGSAAGWLIGHYVLKAHEKGALHAMSVYSERTERTSRNSRARIDISSK
jgi:membrane-associated phospholipid phosphatase